jgi:putative chitinase
MTPAVEHLIAAGIKREVAEKWVGPVQEACSRFGIDTPQRVAAFLAQTAHESGGYTMLTENLNYRAATLAAVWPSRFAILGPNKKPVKDEKGKNKPTKVAESIAGKPEPIANMVYASRMGNGPTESGEGWKYRGRGLKQLTGKDNYTRCGTAIQMNLVDHPDMLLEPRGAALSAGWFWQSNNLSKFADAGDMEGMTKKINGGLIGYPDRKKRYDACLASM